MRCSYRLVELESLEEVAEFVNVPFRIVYIERVGGELYPCGENAHCYRPVRYIAVVEECGEGEGR